MAGTWKIHQSPPYKDVNPMQGWLSRTWCSSGTAMLGNSSSFETSHWILATKPPLRPENNLWQLWRFHSSSWIHPGFLSMLWWTAMHKSMTIIRCFFLARRRHHKLPSVLCHIYIKIKPSGIYNKSSKHTKNYARYSYKATNNLLYEDKINLQLTKLIWQYMMLFQYVIVLPW